MRVRVDFGRIVPGILLFVFAIALLVVLAAVALVSFFFSFDPFWSGVMTAALQLTLVPAVLIAVAVVTMLTGVSWWGGGWLSGIARARARKDRLRISERVGEIVGVVISLIIVAFFYENQVRGVAFFTEAFGPNEQLFFYGPLFTGIVLSIARAVYGRRNGIRPFDSLNMVFLAVSAFWLLSIFPFDFTHLKDLFPSAIQILIGWVTNDIGRLLFFLAGVIASASFVYTLVLYTVVRDQLLSLRAGAVTSPVL